MVNGHSYADIRECNPHLEDAADDNAVL